MCSIIYTMKIISCIWNLSLEEPAVDVWQIERRKYGEALQYRSPDLGTNESKSK